MKSKITDIWKEKYGLSNVNKKLSINSKDNLHSIYKKTAKYIYNNGLANGDFDDQTEYEAILNRTFQEYRKYKNFNVTPIQYNELLEEEQRLLNRSYGEISNYHFYQIKYNVIDHQRSKLILVDPNNTTTNKEGDSYTWAIPMTDAVSRSGFVKYNQNLLIGYDRLQRDLIKNIKLNPETVHLLERLNNPAYGRKRWNYVFEKNIEVERNRDNVREVTFEDVKNDSSLKIRTGFSPHDKIIDQDKKVIEEKLKNEPLLIGSKDIYGNDHIWIKKYYEMAQKENKAIDQIEKYLNETYNLSLQTDFDKTINSNRATFFTTKKQINKATEDKMKELTNKWQDNVKGVELDNEVDLDKLDKLAPEIKSTLQMLPKSENGSKPTIRFRKLKNHKALGIFTPFNNTIAVDFRPDDGGGIGLQSFIHEYGHFLDYNTESKSSKSLSKEFQPIIQKTQAEINHISKDDENGSTKKKTYLSTPTEIFARGFEMYVNHLGFDNSLIKTREEYQKSTRYTTFAPEIKKEMFTYFNKEFPDLKLNIERIHKETDKQQKIEKSVDQLPEREIRRQAFLIEKGRLHMKDDKKVLGERNKLKNHQPEKNKSFTPKSVIPIIEEINKEAHLNMTDIMPGIYDSQKIEYYTWKDSKTIKEQYTEPGKDFSFASISSKQIQSFKPKTIRKEIIDILLNQQKSISKDKYFSENMRKAAERNIDNLQNLKDDKQSEQIHKLAKRAMLAKRKGLER